VGQSPAAAISESVKFKIQIKSKTVRLKLGSGTTPLTITKFARECALRTTVQYGESLGLLGPAARSAGNDRMYSVKDLARLR